MLVDLDGTVLDTNDEVVVFGFRRKHLRGRPLWADATWGDVDPTSAIAPLVEHAALGDTASRTVEVGQHPRRPVRLDLSPVVDRNGDVVLLLAELHRLNARWRPTPSWRRRRRLATAEDFQAIAEYLDLLPART